MDCVPLLFEMVMFFARVGRGAPGSILDDCPHFLVGLFKRKNSKLLGLSKESESLQYQTKD